MLVVGAEVGGGEAEGTAQLVAADHGTEDGVVTAQEEAGAGEIAGRDGGADGGAGDDLAIDADGGDADLVEAEAVAHAAEHFEIAGASASEAPLVADADFAQGMAGGVQLEDEVLRGGGGEGRGEGDDENGLDAEGANEAELVGGGGEEARGGGGTKDFCGVRIEGDGYGAAAACAGIGQGAEEDGAVAEMDAVEDADGEVGGALESGEVLNFNHRLTGM